jgi:hypothetical protein
MCAPTHPRPFVLGNLNSSKERAMSIRLISFIETAAEQLSFEPELGSSGLIVQGKSAEATNNKKAASPRVQHQCPTILIPMAQTPTSLMVVA